MTTNPTRVTLITLGVLSSGPSFGAALARSGGPPVVKLRVVSDGTSTGTRVETLDGELVDGVVRAEWRCDAGGVSFLHLEVLDVPANLVGEVDGLVVARVTA